MAKVSLPQAAVELLAKEQPTRVAVILRKTSPFFSLPYDDVVTQTCAAIGVDAAKSRAKLLTIMIENGLKILGFDLWYDGYDWATAHHPVDLPVILVDCSRKYCVVKVAGPEFRDDANQQVAKQHELHGWDVKPPYFQDRTVGVPTYYNPRLLKMMSGERMVKTPPPGSTSAYPPYTDEENGAASGGGGADSEACGI